jgi:HAE1 family hydrophobic/amphiphilic exporter-1
MPFSSLKGTQVLPASQLTSLPAGPVALFEETRVRPILMTAVATILALTPLAAGPSEGSIIAAELGTVVIGGLLSSTLLTLLVVPVVYSLVDGLKSALSRKRSVAA